MNVKTRNLSRGYPIALLSAAILSATAIFIRFLTQTYQLPALILAFWRDFFVVVTLIGTIGIFKRNLLKVEKRDLGFFVFYGFILATFNSFWIFSVAINGASVSTVLAYSSAAYTTLLGWWLLKEAINLPKIIAVFLCLTGCLLVVNTFDNGIEKITPTGFLIGMISGLLYAIYSLMGRSASNRGINPWTSLFYTFFFASVILLITNLLPVSSLPGKAATYRDFFWLGKAYKGWGILFLLAAGPTVLGFGLYNVSLTFLPSSIANLLITLEPVFTALSAYIFLGEQLSGIQLLGGLLILGGVIFLRVFEKINLKNPP